MAVVAGAGGDEEEGEEVEVVVGSGRDQPKGLGDNTMTGDEGADGEVDSGTAEGAMVLLEESKAEKEVEAARLRELAKVKIDLEDVALIVAEIEVEKKAAELRLREHGGDVVAALQSYV
uniref:Nascent polypeptide-associated complex subunit alpha-like UBA domain-containing protein n=1 Tax=Mantoniella antarctica TaxID=81844 RepID=A0A7S0X7H6_9CHLO|mmetsp:Transcript_25454/g.63725  ORF Transcript_25454/g.63725 Transcript_25454/m.63725 type:complete len:119 (+) Transcript_25454:99-455(+)